MQPTSPSQLRTPALASGKAGHAHTCLPASPNQNKKHAQRRCTSWQLRCARVAGHARPHKWKQMVEAVQTNKDTNTVETAIQAHKFQCSCSTLWVGPGCTPSARPQPAQIMSSLRSHHAQLRSSGKGSTKPLPTHTRAHVRSRSHGPHLYLYFLPGAGGGRNPSTRLPQQPCLGAVLTLVLAPLLLLCVRHRVRRLRCARSRAPQPPDGAQERHQIGGGGGRRCRWCCGGSGGWVVGQWGWWCCLLACRLRRSTASPQSVMGWA